MRTMLANPPGATHIGLFSLVNHDQRRPGHDAAVIAGQIDQAVLADELGLDSFWIAEHHACDYGGIASANAVLAGAIAGRTRRIRIGAGAAIMTLHDPLELAEQWAIVDCISNGRVEFGMARAFLPFEFDLFAVDMAESRERYVESVAIVRHAWSGADVAFEGRFRSIPSVGPLTPLPVQRPHPPMWVTAAMTEESFRWAGREGHRLMVTPYSVGLERMMPLLEVYCDEYRDAGHDASRRRIQATYHLLLADSVGAARHAAEGPINQYVDSFVRAASRGTYASESYASYENMLTALAKLDFAALYERHRLVIGTPETATAQLLGILHESPVTDLTFMVDFGNLDAAAIERTIRLLGTEVVPAMRNADSRGNPETDDSTC